MISCGDDGRVCAWHRQPPSGGDGGDFEEEQEPLAELGGLGDVASFICLAGLARSRRPFWLAAGRATSWLVNSRRWDSEDACGASVTRCSAGTTPRSSASTCRRDGGARRRGGGGPRLGRAAADDAHGRRLRPRHGVNRRAGCIKRMQCTHSQGAATQGARRCERRGSTWVVQVGLTLSFRPLPALRHLLRRSRAVEASCEHGGHAA